MNETRYRTVKPKREDLLRVALKKIETDCDQHGDFVVEVTNGTGHAVIAPVAIECNLPILISEKGTSTEAKKSTTMVTGNIHVPSGKTVERAFHWIDPDGSLKFLRVQAKFRTKKSAWIDL